MSVGYGSSIVLEPVGGYEKEKVNKKEKGFPLNPF